MNFSELTRVIEQVSKDRSIKKEIIIDALEQAVLASARKKFGVGAQLEAHYNEETGEIDLFLFKIVVPNEDEIGDPDMDIAYEEAVKYDPEVKVGDELGIKLDTPTFGRIDAQTAKQIIFQKVRDAERDIIFNEYKPRIGEIITGIARRAERGSIIVDLGRGDAVLSKNDIIPGEVYKSGDRVTAYLKDVIMTTKGPEIQLTRTAPEFLIALFKQEVPEVKEGIIEIKSAAREPGFRAKVAVFSHDRDVDPVGACVGMKGVRVQAIINELKGERIDIVIWNENPVQFVKAALAPAEIASIKVDEANHRMEVIIEDSQLSLAIGKRGQNVRLAAKLTGWRLDVISKTKYQKRMSDAVYNLQFIEGVNETLATAIYQAGLYNVFQVADASLDKLMKIPGFHNKEDALNLKEKAKALVATGDEKLKLAKDGSPLESLKQETTGTYSSASDSESNTTAQETVQDAKMQAEKRLKEAFAESKEK